VRASRLRNERNPESTASFNFRREMARRRCYRRAGPPWSLDVLLKERLGELCVEPLNGVRRLAQDVARDGDRYQHPVEELGAAGIAVAGASVSGRGRNRVPMGEAGEK
jgi:hypothetical protein